MTNAKQLIVGFTASIGVIILALSLLFLYEAVKLPADRLGLVKDAFDLAVSKVLLSMFTTLITAVLTYIFGKQLVSAVSDRLRGSNAQ